MEASEVKRTTLKTAPNALHHMEKLLAQGVASWMVPVPIEDDDVPF